MTINDSFKKAVDEKDLLMVKIMLKDSMIFDPSFQEFNALIAYAEKNMPGLYDKHDGEIFNDNKSEWNEDLLDHQQAILIDRNFSRERITFLRKLCRYLYADDIKNVEIKRKVEKVKKHQETKDKRKNIMLAGAGVAVVGLIAGSTFVTVAGIAVAGYGLMQDRE